MKSQSPQAILDQIAKIQRMERGKLSVIREGPSGPYYKLQAWEKGKNVSRYIPRDQAPAVQEALGGYEQFQTLVEQYAQKVIAKTRVEIAADSKKNKRSRQPSSSPKTPKSQD